MTQSGTVRKMTDGQRSDLIATITGVIPADLTFDEAQAIIGSKGPFVADIRQAFAKRRIRAPGHFPVWRTIQVGTHGNSKGLQEAVEQGGCQISSWAADMMKRPTFTLAKEPGTVNLVRVKVSELGFMKNTPLSQIRDRGVELGLALCEPEDGPQLRLQYPEQPMGEAVWMAMNAIVCSNGNPHIFCVFHGEDGRYLRVYVGYPGRLWGPDDGFVFRKK